MLRLSQQSSGDSPTAQEELSSQPHASFFCDRNLCHIRMMAASLFVLSSWGLFCTTHVAVLARALFLMSMIC